MSPDDIRYIVVHCSATRAEQDIGAREIDAWHRKRTPPFRMIGYHYVIRRNGAIEGGRALNEVGAHVYGYNRVSWGICMVGGIGSSGQADNNFTFSQFASLYQLIANLKVRAPHAELLGHRDLSPDVDGDGIVEKWEWLKDCPCFDVREWWSRAIASLVNPPQLADYV